MKMPGRCTVPKYLFENWGEMEKKYLESHDLVGVDRQGETLIWCRKCSGYARQRVRPKIAEVLHAQASGHQGTWQDD